ncbi:MAG: DUF177 domain-containing protein [Candidatus Aminicenantales bacterium]
MIIDIDRLPKEGLKITRELEFLSVDLVEESAVFLEPTHAELVVKKKGEEIFIKGRVKTCLSIICSRCLAPFDFAVDSTFDLVYFPEELDVVKEQLDNEDINRLFYYSRQLNLREVVLEQLNLTFPLKPLCSPDCQGICPICGQIIKEGECSCVRDKSDPRLEKLKIFLRDKG